MGNGHDTSNKLPKLLAPADIMPGVVLAYKGDTLTVVSVSNRVFITGQPGRLYDVVAIDHRGTLRNLCVREYGRLEVG